MQQSCFGEDFVSKIIIIIYIHLYILHIHIYTLYIVLPIPYRIPIVGAMGIPIEVIQCDEPTPEYVDEILEKLLIEMKVLFDDQKANYGWADKNLVIK